METEIPFASFDNNNQSTLIHNQNNTGLKSGIIFVKDLLTSKNICIPEYQRPYKWSIQHVNQLLDDVLFFRKKSAYRLGTIVFHHSNEIVLQIVDGQQRTITLALLAKALLGDVNKKVFVTNLFSKEELQGIDKFCENLKLTGEVSYRNVILNYREITRRLVDFDEAAVGFLFQRCQLVQVTLKNISEAFQFFDSQNARGKDLDPHDLLKAYHLREMAESASEMERIKAVEKWEQFDMHKLVELFSLHLYRVRNWAKGREARHLTKADIGVFKGVSPLLTDGFPFSEMIRIAHFFNDQYNSDFVRQIDRNKMTFPFQLDQVMINGRRFFEFVDYYNTKVKEIYELNHLSTHIVMNQNSKTILETIGSYEGRHRTGDCYVLNLFHCVLLFYTDKFGWVEIDRAIEKFFLWAFRVRLEYVNVQLATLDNYAIGISSSEQNIAMFRLIHEAIHPSEILNVRIETIQSNNSTNTDKIFDLFKSMGYA